MEKIIVELVTVEWQVETKKTEMAVMKDSDESDEEVCLSNFFLSVSFMAIIKMNFST